ncbi:hypothetical protein [Enterococcus faecium]|uniref:hypothetical protein n=1 Tax=Enterococcus faecium TaxID=1352 RepID=UPI001F0646B7|nr:hypothetical protein [Enterococcus faecium]
MAKEGVATKNPFIRHYNNLDIENTNLEKWELDRLQQKIKEKGHTQIDCLKNSINLSHRKTYYSLQMIIDEQTILNKRIDLITFNAQNLDFQELDEYVKEVALPNFVEIYKRRNQKDGNVKSSYRKLFMMWDILTHGELK